MSPNEFYFVVVFDLEPSCLALLQLWFKGLRQAELYLKWFY